MNAFLSLFDRSAMPLIMSLPTNDPALARAAFRAGADAVKVHINVRHFASGTSFGRLSDHRAAFEAMLEEAPGPVGIVPGDNLTDAARDLDGVRGMTFSFLSSYAGNAPARMLSLPVARMLALSADDPLSVSSALADAGADVLEASVIPHTEYGQALSAGDLAMYRAIVRAAGIPVVVPTQKKITPQDVSLLHRVGVRGLMIGAVVTGGMESDILDAVAAYRRAIDAL